MTAAAKTHRGTIFVNDATVIEQRAYPDDQFILRVSAPECARTAVAGSFAHIRCDADILMRRPLSIMRADANSGEVEFLYKIVGSGLRALSHVRAGDPLDILGPIGNGFTPNPERPRKLMLGGGVGIPPMLFLAEQLHAQGTSLQQSLVVMGSEVPFPFEQTNSAIEVAGMPAEATDAMPDLETIGVPSRLASLQGFSGAMTGYVTDAAACWLDALSSAEHGEVEVFACGPEPMLEAAAKLAAQYKLPCQLCLEEFMACAVGGCAG